MHTYGEQSGHFLRSTVQGTMIDRTLGTRL